MVVPFVSRAPPPLANSFEPLISNMRLGCLTDCHAMLFNRISREKLFKGDLRSMAAVYFLALHFLLLYAFVTR